MLRTPEPELMQAPDQALAYAGADFSETDDRFVQRFRQLFGPDFAGEIVDLGCGPGNIALRMAQAFPGCTVTGVDGSLAMLDIASKRASELSPDAAFRIRFVEAVLPTAVLPMHGADAVVSNSLLHHLHDPAVLWLTLRQVAVRRAPVLVVDLRRPETEALARQIVGEYALNEPEVLRKDFYNSLLAAFEVEEVMGQLQRAGLQGLSVQAVGDRHLEVFGRMPG